MTFSAPTGETGSITGDGFDRLADIGGRYPCRGGCGVRDPSAPAEGRWRHSHKTQAMKLLMTASQIRGLPIVTVRGGEDIAEVRDVIYSPEEGRLVGVTLNQRGFLAGRRREVLPAEAIRAVGQHAVMVLDESSLVAPEVAPDDVAHPATERNVLGDDVLTEGGASLGTVADLVLLVGSSGEVVGYQIDKGERGRGYIPLPAQLSVSGVALVVPNITAEFVQDDLVGLGAAVDEFRDRLGLT